MIIILTDLDLRESSRGKAASDLVESDLRAHVSIARMYAEDVYFWRDGFAVALKRRNAPLVVPTWLHGLTGVDA